MQKAKKISAGGKDAFFYPAASGDRPLIVLNVYEGSGSSVLNAVRELGGADFNLLCISGLDWNRDLSPWPEPAAADGDAPFGGGADDYLDLLLTGILPEAERMAAGEPPFLGIAGYSLAGLFALYALYRCSRFGRVASMSGSLWFPGFREYVSVNSFLKTPDRIYLSLGDAEERTTNPILRTVRVETEWIVSRYRETVPEVIWELNRGNHFKGIDRRTAKGILAILRDGDPVEKES